MPVLGANKGNSSVSDFEPTLRHIERYWEKIIFELSKDNGIHIGLPNRFVSPDGDFFANDQFYWDSYFTILGLVDSGRVPLARGMVDNFAFLFGKFGIVPSRNRFYNLGISQPPFLTSMALEVFQKTQDKLWLRSIATVAEGELSKYWMDEHHLSLGGLSRYCDHFITHTTAEHESGWDMTSRFNDHCLDYLPVDLNSCLYKYESDLAGIHRLLGDLAKGDRFEQQAEKRKADIVRHLWNDKKGFFYDYNHDLKRQSSFVSVAGFYPLWAKLATQEQAEQVRGNVKKLEYDGGLANTQKTRLLKPLRQHDFPNGWAPQQYIAIQGLLNYGFREDAERLAQKWLTLNQDLFLKTGELWEKYNVVQRDLGKSERYRMLSGFGWTNGVFVRLARMSLAQTPKIP